MKTLRALKITSVLQILFCFFCIATNVCFAINRYFDLRIFFEIGKILMYGWAFNPIPIISFIVCLAILLFERKTPNIRRTLEKKWIWIFLWPVIDVIVYLSNVILFVSLTGGV